MLLSDLEITGLCANSQPTSSMIYPFVSAKVSVLKSKKVLSYGLSSFGYDIRLSNREFFVSRVAYAGVIDAKNFDDRAIQQVELVTDETGEYFVIPPYCCGLGVAVERLNMPNNLTAICMGKSTYARVGLIANVTPAEAGWKGHLTLEFSNTSQHPVKIYANEGVVQLLFLQGEKCYKSYSADVGGGKYQNQLERVTLAK